MPGGSSSYPSRAASRHARQVVSLVREGLANPKIAERLFIAPGTVRIHLSHVFRKIGVATRAELAAQATRRGL